MKLVIVDDEPLARQRLVRMVDDLPGWDVVGQSGDGTEALSLIEREQPDVVLLDIRMAGLDGLQVARRLAEQQTPPAVVFTTAFSEHALSAFDTSAVAYLLKPVRKDRLCDALSRARRPSRAQLLALHGMTLDKPKRNFIVAHTREGLARVPIEDVIYFQADQKYTTVYHLNGELLIEDSLRALDEDLGNWFLRIHRKTLVSKRFIAGLERGADQQYRLKLRHVRASLPISRRRLADVRRLLSLEE